VTTTEIPPPETAGQWHPTACILCSVNCGIEVRLDGRRFARIRGDKEHPTSAGYTCEKALRLDHYQNGGHRLTSPLRRRADGTFEEIDWDTAIAEVAARLVEIRDQHGGERIFYYGGGGQGNHLGGAYGQALRKAVGNTYSSNALAQEKTGEFWVDGQLYGRPRCHTTPDFEHAEVAVFIGKNPWHSHGFPRARTILKAIANDAARTMVVIDPRVTETAALADVHLQVRPGTDAFCLAALLGVLVQEQLVDAGFVDEHTTGADTLFPLLRAVPVTDYCERAGVAEADVRAVAQRLAGAASVAVLEDLGIQQAPHSTLNSYLEKLLYLLVGSFGRPGTMNIHTRFASLGGSGPSGGAAGRARTSPVTGSRIITGLVPCNVIPDEILGDHPDRFRAMIVESTNPAHSLADSRRMREALEALDFLVVIDVALTETGRLADYVLPAASQFEKCEMTFFTLEHPDNVVHLRRPLLAPLAGTLPEPEIHARLVRATGVLDGADLAPLHEAAAAGLDRYADAFFALMAEQPDLFAFAPVVLYETLGPTLPDGMRGAAAVWGLAQLCAQNYPDAVRNAGFGGDGFALGNALFEAMLANPSGVVFTVDGPGETWRRIDTLDGRINLAIPDLLPELAGLRDEQPAVADDAFPFVLAAGERRSSTANTIYRDPAWRKKDVEGALRLNPLDARRLGVSDGGLARVTTRRGSATAVVELTDTLQPGHASLPNGLGLDHAAEGGDAVRTGVAPNELTASDDRDWFAGTPWHKHVRARIEAVEVPA
jgi:anaerobic selenocysteine-containing dehydrogenase